MCGIAGIYNVKSKAPVNKNTLAHMTESLHHRGPDDFGYYADGPLGLGHSRLSIIDLSGGHQPIFNENKTIAIVFNGEIFNYVELRENLIKQGHSFYTHSDTEVIVHLYEQYGKSFVEHMNGQFAIALWDSNLQELILTRDRIGIRPLFYSVLDDGSVIFGSEMKSLFFHPSCEPEIDAIGLDEIFKLWVNLPPRTVFKGICELAPGHMLTVSNKGINAYQYWKLTYPDANEYDDKPIEHYINTFQELLYDAVSLRLRADVPVASYLSGGIDSSVISAMVKKHHINDLITFSVAFSDEDFDEKPYQMQMVDYLKTDHHIIEADYDTIGSAFYDVVWYTEKPMIRTAPAPLFLLSGLVRENNIKVVLTGEGADEFYAGYNIFKEDRIRRFWARDPQSKLRPKLLSKLYPYVAKDSRASRFWNMFFKKGLNETNDTYYSHNIRWNNTSQIKRIFTEQYQHQFKENIINEDLTRYIDTDINRWHPLCRAQYLESSLFLPGYLLSSQGDRMLMGNSVEGRFPFLDHRLIEFSNTIPPEYKLFGLNEKFILKKTFKDLVPQEIVSRAKQPYRAPIAQCFSRGKQSKTNTVLTPDKIKEYGYFDEESVTNLFNKFNDDTKTISARDDMFMAGIVSMQLLHHHYLENKNRFNKK